MDPHSPLDLYTYAALLHYFLPKVCAATLCGGIVGIERELKHKAAGIKTNILICVGSCLFAATSMLVTQNATGDPNRITAQILAGIGFIGAGAIFKNEKGAQGLTTASFIWVLAALGIIIGYGGSHIAIVLTLGMVVMTTIFGRVEGWISKNEKE